MDIITVENRNETIKVKQLRQSGVVPCIIYGGALTESLSVQMGKNDANKMFKQKRKGSKIQLKLNDQLIPVQIKDVTRDTLGNEILHISFQALKANQKVNSIAHIIFQNTNEVTGTLEKMLSEIPYSAFPAEMIDTVNIDLADMSVGTIITVGDIAEFQNEKIDLQIDAANIVFKITDKKDLPKQNAE